VIVWVNGTFGVGKTTTATQLVSLSPELRLFDPEWVGYLLMNNLSDHQVTARPAPGSSKQPTP
jgi:hypothetical protein